MSSVSSHVRAQIPQIESSHMAQSIRGEVTKAALRPQAWHLSTSSSLLRVERFFGELGRWGCKTAGVGSDFTGAVLDRLKGGAILMLCTSIWSVDRTTKSFDYMRAEWKRLPSHCAFRLFDLGGEGDLVDFWQDVASISMAFGESAGELLLDLGVMASWGMVSLNTPMIKQCSFGNGTLSRERTREVSKVRSQIRNIRHQSIKRRRCSLM